MRILLLMSGLGGGVGSVGEYVAVCLRFGCRKTCTRVPTYM